MSVPIGRLMRLMSELVLLRKKVSEAERQRDAVAYPLATLESADGRSADARLNSREARLEL